MQKTTSLAVDGDAVLFENLEMAKNLVMHLEDGDIEKADLVIKDISLSRENSIFQNLGKLTRDLHKSMNDINGDVRLNNIMHNEIPDARNSLSHVIGLTEDAANKTLNAIDHSSELIDSLSDQATRIESLLHNRVIKIAKESQLSSVDKELDSFVKNVINHTKIINKDLSDIVVAQSYQDLSGQLIQRVSNMVHDVEHSLVSILKINSNFNSEIENNCNIETKNNAGYGPVVPGVSNGDVLKNQDDVDDLLSTLGF